MNSQNIQFKADVRRLKTVIKELSAEQRMLKPQRKTVHFVGERIVPERSSQTPWGYATERVQRNKEMLRQMFILYGQVRKKPCGYEHLANERMQQKLREQYFPSGIMAWVDEEPEVVQA